MTIAEFLRALEQAIPPGAAYADDPVGLQTGDPRGTLRGVMVAHDVDERTVTAAIRARANCIVCYHPVIHAPLRRLDARDPAARVPLLLARHDITAYAVHTAFDTHASGTNMLLARALGLRDARPLAPLGGASMKIAVFVPAAAADRVALAMAKAGAGHIGDYAECSFRVPGTGTFLAGPSTSPAVGRAGRRAHVAEVRLEMVVPRWRLAEVTAAMRAAHPYEEVAYDVIALHNDVPGIGMGAVGELERPATLAALCARIKNVCRVAHVQTNGALRSRVRRVALVAGSGGSFLDDAVRSGADAFVTGDVRYHSFRAAVGRIAIIDAGHRETERYVVAGLVAAIRGVFHSAKNSHIRVARETTSTNPIIYV